MKSIGFAGSFDPITNGHVHVVEEALKLTETVEIIISVNPKKKYMFDGETRKKMIEETFIGKPVNVHLVQHDYVASYLSNIGCTHMIRGIRNGTDFEYEKLIQRANMTVFGDVQTLFIIPPSDLESVSSSFVKGLVGPNDWTNYIKKFVPRPVLKFIMEYYILNNFPIVNDLSFKNNIFDAYNSPDRYYHNLEHIVNMLTEYKNNNTDISHEITIAILLHDIVYKGKTNYKFLVDPNKSDEENSANNIEIATSGINVDYYARNYITNMIMATKYFSPEWKENNMYSYPICDYDMCIMGKPEKIYDEYKNNIRKEYSEYSDEDYTKGRLDILRNIKKNIEEGYILYSEKFMKKYKEQAIKNINREIKDLENGNKT